MYTSIHLHIILHTAQCDASISFTINISNCRLYYKLHIDTEREAHDPGAGWVGVYRAVMCTPIRVSGTCAISSPTSCCDLIIYLSFTPRRPRLFTGAGFVRARPDSSHMFKMVD